MHRIYPKMQQIAFMVALTFILFIASVFTAANVYAAGTSAGTPIIAVSSNLIIEYQDTNNNPQPTVTGDITLTDTVSAIYGLGLSVLSSSQAVPVSASATFTFTATNKSNTGTTINFALNDHYALPVISYSDNVRKGVNEWQVSTLNGVSTYFVFEDAVAIVTLSVTVNADARDSVTGYVTMNAFLDNNATPNGSYVGLNNVNYGGVSQDAVVVSTIAMSPEIIFITTNILSIIAPTANGYPGNGNDLVPGAKIIYQMVIKNIGMSTANITEVIQNIPNNTAYLLSSMSSTFPSVNEILFATFVDNEIVTKYELDVVGGVTPAVLSIRFTLTDLPPNTSSTLNFTVVVN